MKYFLIFSFSLLVNLPVGLANPIMSFELKPINFIRPVHRDSKEVSFATEVHVTSKISIFVSYMQSKFEAKNGADNVNGFYFQSPSAVQSYKISETGAGALIYSDPSSSSMYLGMGVIQKEASYGLYLDKMPLDWTTKANDPVAKFGYRWNVGSAVMVRAGLNARWTRSYNEDLSGSSTDYYLSRDSEDYIQSTVSDIEGNQELRTSIDLGFGFIF